MKQRLPWILVITVLLCAVVVLLWPTKPGVRQRIELSFLCFSNAATGPEALFAVHNPKYYGGGTWFQTEVDRWEGGRWKPWKPESWPLPGTRFQGGSLLGTVAANGKRIDLIACYPLPDTNDSWRIRTHMDELPPLSFLERLPFLWRNGRQANIYATNRANFLVYWMTNEIGPATSGK